jgi:predicted esterase
VHADWRLRLTRRRLLGVSLLGVGALGGSAWADVLKGALGVAGYSQQADADETPQRGRLLVRPAAPSQAGSLGEQTLGLAAPRDGLLYVPPGYRPNTPAPLVVSLHGAGSNEQRGLSLLRALADEAGLLLLAPASRARTWDVVLGGYGPDVEYIDRALAWTFERYAVDAERLAVGGFSDGASYALSIGLTNGDLFKQILAFSPGFAVPATRRGSPRIFVSHGTQDTVLPIEQCSRRIVPALQRSGYDVRYDEFEGPHAIPPEIARAAVERLLAG